MLKTIGDFIYAVTRQKEIDALKADKDALALSLMTKNTIIYQCDRSKVELAEKIAELEAAATKDSNAIESLKTELATTAETTTPRPSFLGQIGSSYFYYPNLLIGGETIQLLDPRELYSPSIRTKKWAKDNRKLSPAQKKIAAWQKTIAEAAYASEPQGDNWQAQFQTEQRAKGDCEDTSTDFVCNCRALGIPSNEVFLVVGPTSFGYHAYPVCRLSHDECDELGITSNQGEFFIFESTLDNFPGNPRPLNGSNYWINGGASNWEHYGPLEPKNLGNFNGLAPSSKYAAARLEDQKIENNNEKLRAIREHWKKKR